MFDLGNIGAIMRQNEIQRSRQEIALLAVINGIFITIRDYKLREDLAPTIEYALDVCKECVDTFPETGNPQTNFLWIQGKIRKANEFLGEDAGNLYTAIVLAQIAHHSITDLTAKIENKVKLEKLEPLDEVIKGLCEQLDPEGDQFDAYEEADEHLKKLYDLLEFKQ